MDAAFDRPRRYARNHNRRLATSRARSSRPIMLSPTCP